MQQRAPAVTLAVVFVAGVAACGSSSWLAPPAAGLGAGPRISADVGRGESVLRVRWRRLLTDPSQVLTNFLEYKPQEFASATSDGRHVFIGSRGGNFWALDPRDGRAVWRAPIEGGVSSQPLYLPEERAVVVGGSDGALHSFDAATGGERWVYHTKGPIGGTPVYADGVVYFVNGENRIYALDAHGGAWRWQYERETPESFTIRGRASPLVVGGRVYAGFSDGYLVALSSKDGEVVWARGLGGDATRFIDVDATPVLVDNTLFVSSYAGGVYALDVEGGAVRWRFPVEGAGSVVVDRSHVWFTATRAGVHCLDREGRLLWRQSMERAGELSAPVLVDGRLLLVSASENGTYVVNPMTGRLRQFFEPGKGVTAPPFSDGRQVYVLTNTGFFYAFAVAN